MQQLVPSAEKKKKFRDRQDAGRQLAELLAAKDWDSPLVLALPKGGVAVAHEIALRLNAPMEVILVRKLCCAQKPGQHFGAISECGSTVTNAAALGDLHLRARQVEDILQESAHMLERRLAFYRPHHKFPPLAGRSVILVDDFADTGWSVMAALGRIRQEKPVRLTLALPVAPLDMLESLQSQVDELVCLQTPQKPGSIQDWYEDTRRSTDLEVLRVLEQHADSQSRAPKK